MNFLAHALLGAGDADLEVGGFLGDFVHGRPDEAMPAGLRRGIALHRAVDVFTDAHAEVLAAHALFAPPWRRYAGIVLDMWFDHCLARDFARWSDMPLETFSEQVLRHLQARWRWLPPRLQRFVAYMRAQGLPAGYADEAILAAALAGIGQRLTRANPLARAVPELQAHADALQRHFDAFFPQLVDFAAHWRESA
ncbi:MAG TPA: ACP phosphodiesterase [Rhodanobacteraceae bacterium]